MIYQDSVCAKCLKHAKKQEIVTEDEEKGEDQYCTYCSNKNSNRAICFFMGTFT